MSSTLSRPTSSGPAGTAVAAEILAHVRSSGVGDASGTWAWLRQHRQTVLVEALLGDDPAALDSTLASFFRQEFTWGLVSPPDSIDDDLKVWREFTDNRPVAELTSPTIGQPQGQVVDGTFILPDAPRHDYLARQIASLTMDAARPTILEIGGGYGGLAWFLSRRLPHRCHIDCDLPTTLALAYYYLRLGAPELRVEWHTGGEIDTSGADVILVPATFREDIRCGADVACNFISLSEMARSDVDAYLRIIQTNGPRFFLHHNANVWPFEKSKFDHVEVMASQFPIDGDRYREIFRAISPWSGSTGRIREFLYERRG